jgi:hypothetical protein
MWFFPHHHGYKVCAVSSLTGNLRYSVGGRMQSTGPGDNSDLCVKARHCGLPEHTPLVEQVSVDSEAGVPKTAMQIAAAKYRQAAAAEPDRKASQSSPRSSFPKPKHRDEFLHFSVMPGACLQIPAWQQELSSAPFHVVHVPSSMLGVFFSVSQDTVRK